MAQQTEFIPYEQALELKELGFDQECFGYYALSEVRDYKNNGLDIRNEIVLNTLNGYRKYIDKIQTSAPLYQQAFRWFRDTKLSDACVCRYQSRDDGGIYFYYVINHDYGIEETRHFKEGFYTYEEAELACLKKLIEIVKNK